MPFCDSCGSELYPGKKFCSKCGSKVSLPAAATCSGCQKPVIGPEKYCVYCGTLLIKTEPPVIPAIKTGSAALNTPPNVKKTQKGRGCIFKTLVALVIIVVLALVGLYFLGDDTEHFGKENNKELTGTDIPGIVSIDEDFTGDAFERTASKDFSLGENNPTAGFEGMTVNFGEFNFVGDETVSISKYAPKTIQKEGVMISAFEINAGNRKEFDDVITLSLPYSETFLDKSVPEQQSVAAKYYNPDTREWENVPYTVDTKNRLVRITTTHLSKYSVFQVNNANSRKAYITGTKIDLQSPKDAQNILNEYLSEGRPGDLALEGGFDLINNTVGVSSKVNTFFTLSDATYPSDFCKGLDKYTRWAGVGLASVSLAADIASAKTEEDKRRYVTDLVKNIAYSSVDFVGSSFVQVGFVGVFVVDYTLTTFGNTVIEIKLRSLKKVYDYHNKTKTPRKAVEWYRKIVGIYKSNKTDIPQAKRLIEKEIDDYVNKFWTLNSSEQNFLADEAGVAKMPYPNADDITKLKAECRENLMNSLQGVFNRLEMYITEEVKADYAKKLDALKKHLNTKVIVKIADGDASGDEASQYSGYSIRFAPLNAQANPSQWTGVMNESGLITTSFTILGHMQCGLPNQIEVFKPGIDPDSGTPEFVIDFKVTMPETVILLKNRGAKVVNAGKKLKKISYSSVMRYDKVNSFKQKYLEYAFARAGEIPVIHSGDDKFRIIVPATSFTTKDETAEEKHAVTISGFTISGTINNSAKYKGTIDKGNVIIKVVSTDTRRNQSYTTEITFPFSGSVGLEYGGGGLFSIYFEGKSSFKTTYNDGEVENRNATFNEEFRFEYSTE